MEHRIDSCLITAASKCRPRAWRLPGHARPPQPLLDGDQTGIPGVKQVAYTKREALLWVDVNDPLASKEPLCLSDLAGRRLSIAANQKNTSWILTMSSVAKDNALDVGIDEKYCDSLEDFLMNKVGPGDLVLNYKDLFEMTGIVMRRDRTARSFTPPLHMRASVAYADRDDEALRSFVRFLDSKIAV